MPPEFYLSSLTTAHLANLLQPLETHKKYRNWEWMTFEEWKANNLQNDLLSKDEYQTTS